MPRSPCTRRSWINAVGCAGKMSSGPRRFAAYYPFCDYSPELNRGSRTGRTVGGPGFAFIDLEYPEMILGRRSGGEGDDKPAVRVDSLAADHHLSYSAMSAALATRLGCRDEHQRTVGSPVRGERGPTRHRRLHRPRRRLLCDGPSRLPRRNAEWATAPRRARACMAAAAIRAELEQSPLGPILVVTGGFHTAALPELVAARRATPGAADDGRRRRGRHLADALLNFDQLDARSRVCLRDAQSRVLRPFVDRRRCGPRAGGRRRHRGDQSADAGARPGRKARPPRPTPSPPCRWPASLRPCAAIPWPLRAQDVRADAMRAAASSRARSAPRGKSFCV